MKILVFGKMRSVSRLPEEITEDLRLAGHQVALFGYRKSGLEKSIEPILMSKTLGAPFAALLKRKVDQWKPDLVLAIGPFHWLPLSVFERLGTLQARPPLVAWIGDAFGPEAQTIANLFDLVAYTDTGLQNLHSEYGFNPSSRFVPLAALRKQAPSRGSADRIDRLAFVASATPHRRALLARCEDPVDLFGPDWTGPGLEQHHVHTRRLGSDAVARIYCNYRAVLNIRHEQNVINGLNQRHFAPYVQGAPVITDDQPDLDHCFDRGKEIFVYRDADELHALQAELRLNPRMGDQVAAAGQRRVLANHTYAHRVEDMARALGIRTP